MKVTPLSGEGGVLLYKWLMGMCHWLRLHFHHWIDFNVSHISTELLEWGRTFSDFWGVRKFFIFTVRKICTAKCSSLNPKNGSIHKNRK